MEKHVEVVAGISKRVQSFHEQNKPFRIFHGGSNSTRQPRYCRDAIVDTSRLTNVLNIDSHGALVEPNVSMGQLVDATLERGLIPQIVPEFPAITVGGAFAGTAGESSSFRYGFFHEAINWIEVVLANGTVVMASRNENADLLRGAAGTCGTLGVITLLKVDVIPAKAYVELTYLPVHSTTAALDTVKAAMASPENHFVDGILFRKDLGVIMTGRLKESSDSSVPIQRFTRAHDQWFYRHAEKNLLKDPKASLKIAIPVFDYLFRWDRGAFWGGKYAFNYFLVPFNRITRFFLDPFMHTKIMFHALHESGIADETLIQDMSVPLERAEEFLHFLHDTVHTYPLWLCPIRPDQSTVSSFPLPRPKTPSGIFMNVGIWAPGPRDSGTFRDINRAFEQKCCELGGCKCLYARAYYSEEEFWDIYDKEKYKALRRKYEAGALPTVYDKVKTVEPSLEAGKFGWAAQFLTLFWSIWPLRGLYGVLCVILGSDALLKG